MPVREYIACDHGSLTRLDSSTVQLNRELILTAAFGILDSYGLGDLSMRRLARNLDVAPGALYWHFPSKQILLGAVADRILQSHDDDAGAGPADAAEDGLGENGRYTWRQRPLTAAGNLLTRLLSTRDGAEIVSAALATGTLEHSPVGPVSSALRNSPATDPELVAWVIVRYLLGAASELQTAHATDGQAAATDPGAVARIMSGVELILDGATAHPAHAADPGTDPAAAGTTGDSPEPPQGERS